MKDKYLESEITRAEVTRWGSLTCAVLTDKLWLGIICLVLTFITFIYIKFLEKTREK